MTMIILGSLTGIIYFTFTINSLIKGKKEMEKVDLSKYTYFETSKLNLYLSAVGLGLSVVLMYIGITHKNTDNISLAIMLFSLVISELINTIFLNKYYYNNTHIVYNGKIIRIKSIKSIEKTTSILTKEYRLTTINGDELLLPVKQALHVQELMKKKK